MDTQKHYKEFEALMESISTPSVFKWMDTLKGVRWPKLPKSDFLRVKHGRICIREFVRRKRYGNGHRLTPLGVDMSRYSSHNLFNDIGEQATILLENVKCTKSNEMHIQFFKDMVNWRNRVFVNEVKIVDGMKEFEVNIEAQTYDIITTKSELGLRDFPDRCEEYNTMHIKKLILSIGWGDAGSPRCFSIRTDNGTELIPRTNRIRMRNRYNDRDAFINERRGIIVKNSGNGIIVDVAGIIKSCKPLMNIFKQWKTNEEIYMKSLDYLIDKHLPITVLYKLGGI